MRYYGVDINEFETISSLLGIPIESYGQDWEFVQASPEVIIKAIEVIGQSKCAWNTKAAIACMVIASLYEYYRSFGVDHPLLEEAAIALGKDSSIKEAMREFWMEGEGNNYIGEKILGYR